VGYNILGDNVSGGKAAVVEVTKVPTLDGANGNPPLGDLVQASAGRVHACALQSSGRVYCWGYNGAGQTTYDGGFEKTQDYPAVEVKWAP